MSNTVGIDIGTYAIKLVELQTAGSKFEIVKAVAIPNNTNVVIPVSQKDRDLLVGQLKEVFREYKLSPEHIRVGLPEAFISTKIISIPVLTDAELASAIPWQAEQYIPIAAEDLQLEYEVLYRPSKATVSEQMRVLLLGTSKSTISGYINVFTEANLDISIVETQMLALYRILSRDKDMKTTMLVNFGASTMDMLVVHESEFAFVYTYPNGGNVLSRAIERTLGLDPSQAEAYKRAYGLDTTQLEGKVGLALQPVFKGFVAELQKALQYFAGSHQGATVKRIVFTGGSAVLPDLIPVLAQAIPLEIALFSPLNIAGITSKVELSGLDAEAYAVAIGLAMGGRV